MTNIEARETWDRHLEESIHRVIQSVSGSEAKSADHTTRLKSPTIESTIDVNGDIEKRVMITLDAAAALAWASDMIGEPVGGLNDLVYDSVGELANLVAGGAKSDWVSKTSLETSNAQLGIPKVTLDPPPTDSMDAESTWFYRYKGGVIRVRSR